MYPLLFCSVLTLAVILDKSWFWVQLGRSRHLKAVAHLCDGVVEHSAQLLSSAKADVVGRVLLAGFTADTPAHGTRKMEEAAHKEMVELGQHLGFLNTMVTLTPLLGIFGTVLGIIDSFQLLGDASLADPVAASAGLAQALVTTAFGLAIAMPSLIAAKVFQTRALEVQTEMAHRCTEFEANGGRSKGSRS